jgi:hypothetical protein
MYLAVREFIMDAVKPEHVAGKDVLEAGALDVNGSVRPFIESMHPKTYLATDMMAGPGVDLVCLAEDLPPLSADLVISTEMLEHAYAWRGAMLGMTRAIHYGGWLALTTCAPGFPYHAHPHDYWRFTPEVMRAILIACGFNVTRCEGSSQMPSTFALAQRARVPKVKDLDCIEADSDISDVGNAHIQIGKA